MTRRSHCLNENPLAMIPTMPSNRARSHGLLLFALLVSVPPDLCAESALDALLNQIPTNETGDANQYCLTDVQFALDAGLSWNPLLKRAVLRDEKSGISVTLIVGSKVGRVGLDLVEWPTAPSFHEGQIYLSRGFLETVFSRYPDYRLPGQSQETPLPIPASEPPPLSEAPEEPPTIAVGEATPTLESVLAVLYPPQWLVVAASSEVSAATSHLLKDLTEAFAGSGIGLQTEYWQPKNRNPDQLPPADALIAIRIRSASPSPKTSFVVYEGLSIERERKSDFLVEWGQSVGRQQRQSRELGEVLFRNYARAFGRDRTMGLKSGPVDLLRGRQGPALLINLGVESTSAEQEFRKTAEVVAQSLTEWSKGS